MMKYRIYYCGFYEIEAETESEAFQKDKDEAEYEEWETQDIEQIDE